jgi:hypothetical protein
MISCQKRNRLFNNVIFFHAAAGKCTVVTEEVTANKEVVKVQFAAKDLDKKDTFGSLEQHRLIMVKYPLSQFSQQMLSKTP